MGRRVVDQTLQDLACNILAATRKQRLIQLVRRAE